MNVFRIVTQQRPDVAPLDTETRERLRRELVDRSAESTVSDAPVVHAAVRTARPTSRRWLGLAATSVVVAVGVAVVVLRALSEPELRRGPAMPGLSVPPTDAPSGPTPSVNEEKPDDGPITTWPPQVEFEEVHRGRFAEAEIAGFRERHPDYADLPIVANDDLGESAMRVIGSLPFDGARVIDQVAFEGDWPDGTLLWSLQMAHYRGTCNGEPLTVRGDADGCRTGNIWSWYEQGVYWHLHASASGDEVLRQLRIVPSTEPQADAPRPDDPTRAATAWTAQVVAEARALRGGASLDSSCDVADGVPLPSDPWEHPTEARPVGREYPDGTCRIVAWGLAPAMVGQGEQDLPDLARTDVEVFRQSGVYSLLLFDDAGNYLGSKIEDLPDPQP